LDIISRADAREQNMKLYFTGIPCKYGHIDKRRVSNSACLTCEKARTPNLESARRANKAFYDRNIEACRKRALDWRNNNLEKARANSRKWNAENKERLEIYWMSYRKTEGYRRTNMMHNAKKRARLERAYSAMTPEEILELQIIYEEAAALGDRWEVDHITPLSQNGDHRPYNMQIVRAPYNRWKNAKVLYTPADLGKHLPEHYKIM